MNNGFADRCLNHLAMPPNKWSGRTDLNRRRPPWQGGTLPLSYARSRSTFPYIKLNRFVNRNSFQNIILSEGRRSRPPATLRIPDTPTCHVKKYRCDSPPELLETFYAGTDSLQTEAALQRKK